MYALIRGDWTIRGFDKVDLIRNTGKFAFDTTNGILYFENEKDTITYSTQSYTEEEMVREMTKRAIQLLNHRGWELYKKVD